MAVIILFVAVFNMALGYGVAVLLHHPGGLLAWEADFELPLGLRLPKFLRSRDDELGDSVEPPPTSSATKPELLAGSALPGANSSPRTIQAESPLGISAQGSEPKMADICKPAFESTAKVQIENSAQLSTTPAVPPCAANPEPEQALLAQCQALLSEANMQANHGTDLEISIGQTLDNMFGAAEANVSKATPLAISK